MQAARAHMRPYRDSALRWAHACVCVILLHRLGLSLCVWCGGVHGAFVHTCAKKSAQHYIQYTNERVRTRARLIFMHICTPYKVTICTCVRRTSTHIYSHSTRHVYRVTWAIYETMRMRRARRRRRVFCVCVCSVRCSAKTSQIPARETPLPFLPPC